MPTVEIQGIHCKYRDLDPGENVLYENLPQDEQVFRRITSPFTDDELIAIANRELTYTDAQKKWVDGQEKTFDYGLYAYIDGVKTFLPGSYWCYCNFWKLEHGEYPEYREDDRLFFLFHEYCRLQTKLLGVTRGKGRRQGATSIGMFFMWFIAGRKEFSNCGTTSFSDTASMDNFQKMFMYGFKAMLPCFQADFDSDSENFIRFVKPVDKRKKGVLAVKREGLNSYVDYKANAINSYDSGRQTYNVPDEGGKRMKLNINSYWSRLNKTMRQGANKVGFGYLPTTVGAKDQGGEEFKTFWKNASQFRINPKTGEPYGEDTPSRVVRYFVPATKCYSGYIDKFGRSIEDDPEKPVLSNTGEWITEGARTAIKREREGLEDEQLMEHRRDYPLTEYDLFAFETGKCEYNEANIVATLEYLEAHPEEAFWRRGRLYEEYDRKNNLIVKYADDEKGSWWIKEMPNIENCYIKRANQFEAANTLMYQAGADTYKNIFAESGSAGVLVFFKKSHIVEGKETGMYPVAIFDGRPKLIELFNREAFMGCLWYGCKINFEIDAGTWFFENFATWNATRLLDWSPAANPLDKGKKIKPGTESASPYQLAKQLEVSKLYMDGTSPEDNNGHGHLITYVPMLKQLLEYNHAERTPYHLAVALQMCLLPLLSRPMAPPPKEPEYNKHGKVRGIMPTTKIIAA